jgi:glycosyltransferase involved in cell wall biosynthesis
MENLTVILRTCDRLNTVSGANRLRDFGTKSQVLQKCCKSIKDSIDHFISNGGTCRFIIVDDHSSEDTLQFLKSLNPTTLINLEKYGNGSSFGYCIDLAKNEEGLVFLVEDDYLLKTECIFNMVSTYTKLTNSLNLELCIFPTDYPNKYNNLYLSYVVLGSDRHYRTVKETTCTFMYKSHIFKEFENELKKYSYDGCNVIIEANSVNLVYQKYICFSPIPSMAEHYQYFGDLSPFYKQET